MTNGEKLDQVFPDGICPFSKNWLDYEYKEPLTKVNQDLTKNKSEIPTGSTTKNNLGVDTVSRQAINGYIDYILSHGMGKKKSFDYIKKFVANLPSATPQEPILDKIRAEIDKIYEREGNSFDCLNALDELKEFIDKYKAESED